MTSQCVSFFLFIFAPEDVKKVQIHIQFDVFMFTGAFILSKGSGLYSLCIIFQVYLHFIYVSIALLI
jgi:hypothetical protein